MQFPLEDGTWCAARLHFLGPAYETGHNTYPYIPFCNSLNLPISACKTFSFACNACTVAGDGLLAISPETLQNFTIAPGRLIKRISDSRLNFGTMMTTMAGYSWRFVGSTMKFCRLNGGLQQGGRLIQADRRRSCSLGICQHVEHTVEECTTSLIPTMVWERD